tara:strand:+ start:710 stop:1051 length:342 start_codon:yes stop_codon:yes gene_type:complete
MEWLKERTGQLTVFVGILSTLTGFGWAGAELYNRLVVVEKKIQSSAAVRASVIEIEKRFEGLDVEIVNLKDRVKKIPDNTELYKSIADVEADIKVLNNTVEGLKQNSGNPLAN